MKYFWKCMKEFWKGFGQGIIDGLKLYLPIMAVVSVIISALGAKALKDSETE